MFKLFGDKKNSKKSGYFLELKEDIDNGALTKEVKTPVAKEVKTPVAKEVKTPVTEEVKTPVAKEVKTPVTEEVKTPVVETAQQNGKKGKSPTPVATKKKKDKSKIVEKSKTEPVEAKAVVKEEPKQVNFATDYLLTQTFSRRLPGPSLNNFKNMARQIKK